MDLITIAIRVFQLIDSIERLFPEIERTNGDCKDLRTELRHANDELKGFHQLLSHLDKAIDLNGPSSSFFIRKLKIATLAEKCSLKLQQFIKRVQQGKASNEIGSRSAWRIHDIAELERQVVTSMELLITEILVYIMWVLTG